MTEVSQAKWRWPRWAWPGLLAAGAGGAAMFLLRGCWHRRMGWPMREGAHSYQVCLGCGIKRLFDEKKFRGYGSPANGNNAVRTLRRMLNKAREWKVIRDVPDFKLFKEESRALRLDDEAEARLLLVAEQPLKDIIVMMRDTGMRNARELYRMRVENIDWNSRVIFNPNSKTKRGRRFIPMSDRVMNILLVRCAERTEGWCFLRVKRASTSRAAW